MIDSSGEPALLKVAAILSPLLGSGKGGLAPLPPQLRLLSSHPKRQEAQLQSRGTPWMYHVPMLHSI